MRRSCVERGAPVGSGWQDFSVGKEAWCFCFSKVTSIHFQDRLLGGILWALNKHCFPGLVSGPDVWHRNCVKSIGGMFDITYATSNWKSLVELIWIDGSVALEPATEVDRCYFFVPGYSTVLWIPMVFCNQRCSGMLHIKPYTSLSVSELHCVSLHVLLKCGMPIFQSWAEESGMDCITSWMFKSCDKSKRTKALPKKQLHLMLHTWFAQLVSFIVTL